VNIQVASEGGQTFSSRRLAETIKVSEFDPEIISFIRDLESRLV